MAQQRRRNGADGRRRQAVPARARRGARVASRSDLPAVLSIEREVFPRSPFSRAQISHLLCSPSSVAHLLRDGGEAAGFVAVWWRRGASTCRIVDLAVRPRYRRRGVGHALVRAAVAHGRRHGFAGITLEVAEGNAAARKLYEKLGFRLDRHLPHYYARGRHALRLVRWLQPGVAGP